MNLVHEFEELVDDRLEELPVRLQESRILAHYIHNIRSNDGLVVLSSFNLAKAEEILDNSDQETLLGLLVCTNS